MIVRTYGRRKGPISGTCSASSSLNDDVVSEPFRDSLSQDSDPLCGFAFSSQDSSSQHWSLFDSDPIDDFYGPSGGRESKRARRAAEKRVAEGIPATSTLMEAQEFGEMMEHVDEVNFALDGLRKGQPLRIRRASLVSLLSICATTYQRRLLRTQGCVNFAYVVLFLMNLERVWSLVWFSFVFLMLFLLGLVQDFEFRTGWVVGCLFWISWRFWILGIRWEL